MTAHAAAPPIGIEVRGLRRYYGDTRALDGLDLARETHARWPDIKLIVTSGRPKPSDKDIPDDGRFVAKPYSPDLLVGEIRRALAG